MPSRRDRSRDAEAERWYAQYGRTMLGYQSLEMSMAFLVVMDQDDPPPLSTYGEAVKNLNKLYKLTIGALQRRVGKDLPQELIDDLEQARRGRNYLAHQYLVERVEELDRGSAHRLEMIRGLEATQRRIGDILRTITELGREGASQIGLDPLAARRFAEQLHDDGIGFGTIRHELNPLIAERLDAVQRQEQPPPE
jgi:hypothetical protein